MTLDVDMSRQCAIFTNRVYKIEMLYYVSI